jgi:TRAP-type C4-dicarboxylate transport system substrate-binding protein
MKHAYKFASVLAVSLVAAGLAHADAPQYVLKLAHADSTDPSVSRKAVMAEVFKKEVEAKSHGRIKVEVFGGGALGGEKQYVEGVKNGFIQAGLASAVIADYFPPAMVTDIPYLFPTAQVADKVMDGPFGKKLSADFQAKTGMINLCFGEVGYRDFTSGKKPIESPADLKGMKIRVMESPVYLDEMKALGAQPTPVAWPETYSALQTG